MMQEDYDHINNLLDSWNDKNSTARRKFEETTVDYNQERVDRARAVAYSIGSRPLELFRN